MIIPKYKPIINKQLLKTYTKMPCKICYKFGCNAHHIISKAFLRLDVPENLKSLCFEHHREAHDNQINRDEELWKQIKEKYYNEFGNLK